MCRPVLVPIRIQISISVALNLIGFVTMLLLFYVFLGWPRGMDPSSSIRGGTSTPQALKAKSSPLGLKDSPSKSFVIHDFMEQANEGGQSSFLFLRIRVSTPELGDCGGV